MARRKASVDAREIPVQQSHLVVRCGLGRGRAPEPGFQRAPYKWDDLLDGPPPTRTLRGGGMHATYHGTEPSEYVRISYSTVIRVDPGADLESPHDDIISVDERITVRKRPLHELVDRERAYSNSLTARWQGRLAERLAKRRARAAEIRWRLLASILLLSVRLEARAAMWWLRTVRSVLRGLVAVPDRIVTRGDSARAFLSTRSGRRGIMAGLRDPRGLDGAMKGVVLFLVGMTTLTFVLALNTLFTVALPQHAPAYQAVLRDATGALITLFGPPIPQEPLLIGTALQFNPYVAFIGGFAGKMLGVWLLYLLGDSLHAALKRQTASKPRTARAIAWLQSRADKSGFWLLVPLNAIPLVPDLILVAFAVSGMRFRPYFAGIAVGTALKFGLILGGLVFVGPDRVREALDALDPF